MRTLVNVGIVVLVIAIVSTAVFGLDIEPVQAPTGPSKIDVVDGFIERQAKKLSAEEYAEAREIVRGDMNGDGKADLVVLYTLEGFGGGNAYRQYLAIFLAERSSFRYATQTAVGGKLFRLVSSMSVFTRRVNLDTKEYRKNDAACCPGKGGKTSYSLKNGKLIERKQV